MTLPDMPPPRERSLPEVHGSIAVSQTTAFKRLFAFVGPGLLVSVGYMDPGNWATDLAAGSRYEYQLLSVVLLSNWLAILFQFLSLKLGIVTQRDLAQACRDYFPRSVSFFLWVVCEIAIIACDLAEVLGSAIALKLLFGIPILAGVCITVLDVFVILYLQKKGFRLLEALVGGVIFLIALCFGVELFLAAPEWGRVAAGLIPQMAIVTDPARLYIAIGILGATVMPHNLYLHSSIVQTRAVPREVPRIREAIRGSAIDSTVSLSLAFFVNAAILVVAAAAFYANGRSDIAEIEQAYAMLTPLLGVGLASTLFALALLCSGQNATLTGTLAGQIVMEGFLSLKIPAWLRRLITRALAIIPAVIVIALYGEEKTTDLLILSQVILSAQLPFAVLPLVYFTGNRRMMGSFVNSLPVAILAWLGATLVVGLNVWLLTQV
jgi:manganese transport protein